MNAYQFLHPGIGIVDDEFLVQCVPRPWLIGIYLCINLEQDVQNGYQHSKGEHVHPL